MLALIAEVFAAIWDTEALAALVEALIALVLAAIWLTEALAALVAAWLADRAAEAADVLAAVAEPRIEST